MIPFPTADQVWPRGSALWRMCVLPHPPDEHGLQRLLDRARKAMAPFPLAEVADADLNVGICPLDLPNRDLDGQFRREVSTALTAHFADLPPFTMAVAAEHVGVGSVVLELRSDRWPDLTRCLGTSFDGALEAHQVGPMHTFPHLTIGYGAGHCDSGEIAAALHAALHAERAVVLVDAVHLVQVRQDVPGHGYHLAAAAVTVPLGGARPAPRGGGAR